MLRLLLFVSSISSAPVGSAISGDPALSHMAAAVAAHPEWNTSPTTILVGERTASNAASLTAGDAGYVYLPSALNYATSPAYVIFNSTGTSQRIVYDNYAPGTNTNIHVRFGLADAVVSRIINADNGFIFVTNLAILPPAPLIPTLTYQGCGEFAKALQGSGLESVLDSARGLTIFAPNDAAMNAFTSSAQFAALSPSQRKAVFLYHVLASYVVSTQVSSAGQPTLLAGNTLPITAGRESIIVGSDANVLLSDTFTVPGVIHTINRVVIPPNMPSAGSTVDPVGIAGSPGPTNNSTTTSKTNGPTSPTSPSSGSLANGYITMAPSLVLLLSGLFFGAFI